MCKNINIQLSVHISLLRKEREKKRKKKEEKKPNVTREKKVARIKENWTDNGIV